MLKMKFKKNELCIGDKIQLIKDDRSGQYDKKQLASKYKISSATVYNITKDAEKYLSAGNRNKKSKRIKTSKIEKLNEIVLKFIQSSNATKVPINGPLIKGFALEIKDKMNLNNFEASNGWLEKFIERYDIKYNTFSGESADISENTVEEWINKLNELSQGFEPKNIFNFDETGLFYKLLPKKSYLIKGSQYIGGKKSKLRSSLGFCCSMAGEKLKPVIIGMKY